MAREDIPTSRIARSGKVGRLAATQALRHAGTRTANRRRTDEEARKALEARYLEAADEIVAVLGTMKGAAMKLGQMLSVLDIGLVPAEARPEFQRKLAALRDSAPDVSFGDMRAVIEQDLGGRVEDHFPELEERPIGAASIGQVYRGRLADGRRVAVKVQYPGIATAVRADMKNLALVLRVVKRFMPGLDTRALADELRDRVGEELDYAAEARNQAEIGALYEGHPFIVIPATVPELCNERVLTMEYVAGTGFERLKEADDDVRDRVGEIVYRFYCGSLYRNCRFSGDPHPGNLLLQDDGRVAFLDFGLFKRMDADAVAFELACQRAGAEGDTAALHRLMADAGILPEPDRVDPGELMAYVHDAVGWYLADEEIRLSSDEATASMIQSADPRSPYFRKFKWQHLPPEHLFARRTELFTLALLGQLGAAANWHRIAREWTYGDPPVTELGELEAEFLTRASHA